MTALKRSAPKGPGSWGFEGPEPVQPGDHSRLSLQMTQTLSVGASSVDDCCNGTSSVVWASMSGVVGVDGKPSEFLGNIFMCGIAFGVNVG